MLYLNLTIMKNKSSRKKQYGGKKKKMKSDHLFKYIQTIQGEIFLTAKGLGFIKTKVRPLNFNRMTSACLSEVKVASLVFAKASKIVFPDPEHFSPELYFVLLLGV